MATPQDSIAPRAPLYLALPHSRTTRGWWACLMPPVGLIGLAALGLSIDLPMARFFAKESIPTLLREFFENTEGFGHAFGVLIILLAVLSLDSRRRWIVRLLICAYGGGVMANVVKMMVARTRPRDFLPFSESTDPTTTFERWFPILTGGPAGQSFPSAHTATAVGLALGLTWMYPRGRWFFGAMAFCVAFQRVLSGAHFPSDVCAGAAVGWLTAQFVLCGPGSSRWDQWESGKSVSNADATAHSESSRSVQ